MNAFCQAVKSQFEHLPLWRRNKFLSNNLLEWTTSIMECYSESMSYQFLQQIRKLRRFVYIAHVKFLEQQKNDGLWLPLYRLQSQAIEPRLRRQQSGRCRPFSRSRSFLRFKTHRNILLDVIMQRKSHANCRDFQRLPP
jgi:hypothetical protein